MNQFAVTPEYITWQIEGIRKQLKCARASLLHWEQVGNERAADARRAEIRSLEKDLSEKEGKLSRWAAMRNA